MKSFWSCTVLALAVGGAFASPAVAFEFPVPDGWRDLSPNAPVANFKGVPDPIVHQATQGDFVAFAMDPQPEADGTYAVFNVKVMKESSVISDSFMQSFVDGLTGAVSKRGFRYDVNERRIDRFEGTRVGRVVGTLTLPNGSALRQLIYVMPGQAEIAIVMFICTPQSFEQRRPAFEAAAHRIKGLAEPSPFDMLFRTDRGHYILGYLAGGLVGVLVVVGVMVAVVKMMMRR
jgi:hypothetical protein